MNRRSFLLAPVALALLGSPAPAAGLSLAEISDYLNGIGSAETRFTQINDDGTTSTGRLLIRRPGRIRFEYDPPETALVMAGQGQVAVFDARSNEPPERFPLVRTPLKLLLTEKVELQGQKMVVGLRADDDTTTVIAQDPKRPEYGRLHLVFANDPIALRRWIIEDGSGQRTTVILDGLKASDKRLPGRLFDIKGEMARRGF